MIKHKSISSIIVIFILFSLPICAQTLKEKKITEILNYEKNSSHSAALKAIVDENRSRYHNLYQRLKSGEKITVFIDPAHGKLASGSWQGSVTFRESTTGKPEEYYSIPLSRELYKLLVSNPYIRVASTYDFMQVLQNKNNNYNNISFSKTIELAKKTNSFIILASHLNNISPIHKAEGKVNMFGIHITCNRNGDKYISNITSVQRGFLTLYNRFDSSGFCRTVAERMRENNININMYPNAWDNSMVADDRFSYFSAYPFSIIYESGFISNPVEERFLLIPENQRLIASSQYKSLVESINQGFGVDISGGKLVQRFKQPADLVNDVLLSQIAIYYIKQNERKKAADTCSFIANNSGDKPAIAAYYRYLSTKIRKADKYLTLAQKHNSKKKKYSKYTLKAARSLGRSHIFKSMRSSIYASRKGKLGKTSSRSYARSGRGRIPEFKPLSLKKEKHNFKTPFLLTIKPGQTLKDAIDNSIAPNDSNKKKIYSAFTDVKITKVKWVRSYSKKRKKYYWQKKRYKVKKTFTEGIYIVKISSKFKVESVKNVKRVPFDPSRYQNQEYFKNSCLSKNYKKKSL